MEFSDVVFDDRCLPGDGGAHECSVQRPDRAGKGDRL